MSNLSNIGFGVAETQELENMLNRIYPIAKKIRVAGGMYVQYTDPSGAAVWIQVDKDNQFAGISPHFNGSTKRKVFITAPVKRSHSHLEGAWHAWANPADEHEPESGDYPFVFDTPDSKTHRELGLPIIKEIQLTAFAQYVEVYPDEATYNASQERKIKMASRSFIPSSLFAATDNENDTDSDCTFSGHIMEFELLENQFTKQKFYRLRVDTLGGEVDVVADPELFETEPVLNGIINGGFWLSARFTQNDDQPAKKNFFQRLFKK